MRRLAAIIRGAHRVAS